MSAFGNGLFSSTGYLDLSGSSFLSGSLFLNHSEDPMNYDPDGVGRDDLELYDDEFYEQRELFVPPASRCKVAGTCVKLKCSDFFITRSAYLYKRNKGIQFMT
ncbi:hypothetical protein CAPTEDRAFT_185776 [Capitella teleta]|uniref:Uncharacterized protein n=1 Tax=Capitella teleta TaxID=283909 RepID=R7VI60_CAPTE|nr:hypothetical protein CAPTEDRAFT_185776 [Capitella teleta]|eukprot:ELU18294.1 hypothetical protein CAPTEDRAFT_185776 [Capitella teleta]